MKKYDQWYEVPVAYSDAFGYRLTKGSFVRPTGPGAPSSPYGEGIIPIAVWDGKNYNQSRSIYITKGTTPKDFLTRFRALSKDEMAEIERVLQERRLANPSQYVRIGAAHQIGTDPEVFALRGNGTVLPAFEFLPSEAKAPKVSIYDNYTVAKPYWDGFQGEFKIAPCSCLEIFTSQMRIQLRSILESAKAVDPKAQLTGRDVMPIPADVMASAKPNHVALGCAPSQNAYGMGGLRPSDPQELTERFAGCHFHISLKPESDHAAIIKEMDNLAGVVSVALLQGLESPIRRRYYGLAGEYRTPKYGVEYRTLSSAILWHPVLVHIPFGLCRTAAQMVEGNFKFWDGSADETVDIINNLNVDQARVAMKRNRTVLEGLIRWIGRIGSVSSLSYGETVADNAPLIFDTLMMEGVAQHISLNIPANWCLTDDRWGSYGRGVGAQAWEFFQKIKPARTRAARG